MELLNGIIGGVLGLANRFGDKVFDAVGGVLGWLFGQLANFVTFLSAALPDNPLDIAQFFENLEAWNRGLCWLNWFIPINQISALLAGWVAATLVYYTGRIVLYFIGKLNLRDVTQ